MPFLTKSFSCHIMLELHIKVFQFLGCLQTENKLFWVIGTLNFLQYGSLAFISFVQIFYTEQHFEKLTSIFEVWFLLVAVNIKIYSFYWKRDTISYFISFMQEHQHKLSENDKKLSEKMTKMLWILLLVTVICYGLKPLMVFTSMSDRTYEMESLIFPAYMPVKVNHAIYIFIYVWEFYMCMYGASTSSTWDAFVVSMMIFVAGQLKYVNNRVRTLQSGPFYRQYLIEIIHHHQKLMRYVLVHFKKTEPPLLKNISKLLFQE